MKEYTISLVMHGEQFTGGEKSQGTIDLDFLFSKKAGEDRYEPAVIFTAKRGEKTRTVDIRGKETLLSLSRAIGNIRDVARKVQHLKKFQSEAEVISYMPVPQLSFSLHTSPKIAPRFSLLVMGKADEVEWHVDLDIGTFKIHFAEGLELIQGEPLREQ